MRAMGGNLIRSHLVALSVLPWIPGGIAHGQPDHERFNPYRDGDRPEHAFTPPPLHGVPHGASVAGPAVNPMAPIAPPSTYAPPAGAPQGEGYGPHDFRYPPRHYYRSPYYDHGAYGTPPAPAPYAGYAQGPGAQPTSSYSQDPRALIQLKLRKLLQSRAHEAGIQDCPMPQYPDLRYATPSPLTCR